MASSSDASPSDRLGRSPPSVSESLSAGLVLDEASTEPSFVSNPAFLPCAPSSSSAEASLNPFVPSSLVGSLVSSPLASVDPVTLALGSSVGSDSADASKIDIFDAMLELCLPPACGAGLPPVTGAGFSPVPASAKESVDGLLSYRRPYQSSSFYPVRSSGLDGHGCLKTSSSSFQTEIDFGCLSFPPLPKSGGNSNLPQPPSSPTASAPSVSLPGMVPAVADPPEAAKHSWATIVSDKPTVMELAYHKPTVLSTDGKVRFSLPPAVAINGAAAWENTLVGFFLDKLPFSLVNSQAHRLWDAKGLSEVLCNGNGFFFFKFNGKALCLDILNGGPWYFGGRPIFLKAWRSGMNLSKEGCKRVPIWAHFLNVPLEFWTAEGLSHIASIVGIPLHADKMTSSLKRLSYARICIEIGIDDPLPNSLDLVLEDGNSVEILIEYNWVPKRCSSCKAFGHLPANCKQRSRQAWVPKASPSSPKPCADPNPIHQASSGIEAQAFPASLPDLDSLRSQRSSGGTHPSPIIPAVGSSDSGAGGVHSSNPFALLQSMDDVHAERKISSSSLQLVDTVGGSGTIPLAYSSALCPVSSAPPAACSGLEASPIGSVALSSPSSFSSTPLLARRLILVDELEKKQGKQPKSRKKSKSVGKSNGKISLNPDD